MKPPLLVLAAVSVALSGCYVSLAKPAPAPSGPPSYASLFKEASQDVTDNKLNAASKVYSRIIRLNPLDKYAYYNLGVIQQKENDLVSAYYSYQRALLIDQGYPEALYNLAYLLSSSQPQSAVSLYQRLEAVSPRNAATYFNLALLELDLGQRSEAVAQMRKAVKLEPSLAGRAPAQLLPKGG